MAFPQILGTITKGINGSNTLSHSVTLPTSISAGELIVVCMAFDGVPIVTPPANTIGANIYDGWSGHSQRGTIQATPTACMFWKRALGTESGTTITFTSDASEQSSWIAFRMSVGTIATLEGAGEFLQGSSTNSTFNAAGSSLSPTRDHTIIAMRSGDSNTQVTAPSTNYTLVDSQAGGTNNAALYVEKREINCQTETAGAVSVATEQWMTIAVGFYFDANTIELEQNVVLYDGLTPSSATAWSFVSNGLNLKKIITQAFKGTTALSLYAEIYAHSGTYRTTGNTGTGIPTGSAIAASSVTTITGTNDYGNIEFTFATPYQTTNGTPYFIVIRDGSTNALSSISFYQDRLKTAGDNATFSGGVWSTSSTLSPAPYTLLSASGINATISETGAGTDTPSASATFARALSESATALETSDKTLQTSASITEAAAATEVTDGTKGGIAASLTESTAASDSISTTAVFSQSLNESGSASESVSTTATLAAFMTETAASVDSVTATGTLNVFLTETASGTDIQSGGVLYALTISEASTATESSVAGAFLTATATESATATDSIAAVYILGASLTEATTSTDTLSVTRTASLTITETAAGADSISVNVSTTATITESVAAIESCSNTATRTASLTEAAAAADSIVGGLGSSKTITEAAIALDAYSATITTGIGYLRNARTIVTLTSGSVMVQVKKGSIIKRLQTGSVESGVIKNKIINEIKSGSIETQTGL